MFYVEKYTLCLHWPCRLTAILWWPFLFCYWIVSLQARPPALAPPHPPILMNGSEAEPRDDGMERVRKPQPPPLDRSFLLKVVKTHLRDPHREEGAVLQNGLRGRKSTNSACSSWTVCGIDVREGQRKKPRHQSACRLSGIEPAGTSF